MYYSVLQLILTRSPYKWRTQTYNLSILTIKLRNNKLMHKELRDLPAATRCICGKWGLLGLINDVLYIVELNSNPRLLVLNELISQVHHQLRHTGRHKTDHATFQRFWWPLLQRDVTRFCQNCDLCSRNKQPTQTPRWVGTDIMGLLPGSESGNRYTLVMIGYFTKWCEVVSLQPEHKLMPSKNQSANPKLKTTRKFILPYLKNISDITARKQRSFEIDIEHKPASQHNHFIQYCADQKIQQERMIKLIPFTK
ncbi:unnamed protein product [Trichobilharzia regenti]|nr:unnamed protein product [Trichobilharzia regenti]